MNAPCSTKVIKQSPHLTLIFLGTSQVKGWNLFVMSLMEGQRMNEARTKWNLLLLLFWSISKMKYNGRINSATGKNSATG